MMYDYVIKHLSQNHRMAFVGTIIKLQPPCQWQGHQPPYLLLAQAAQGPIQPGLEHLQGFKIHIVLSYPVILE